MASRKSQGRLSLGRASLTHGEGEDRPEYANNLELLLTLVGYAVGLGNIWRFPYLAYAYGGGAFLIPYFLCLIMLGLPLFILEMGLGQVYRQGTMGVWPKIGLVRLQGIGIGATMCTWLVSLYYNVILAWTIYYLGRTVAAMPSGVLPWSDQAAGFQCAQSILWAKNSIASSPYLDDKVTGLYNKSFSSANGDFWCPEFGIPTEKYGQGVDFEEKLRVPDGFTQVLLTPQSCPARAAVKFWEEEALQQSSGMDEIGGLHFGLAVSLTLAWLLVYLIIFKGVQSSGKVVYVTALLPYVALISFFFRSITLPGAGVGLAYYCLPDLSILLTSTVWIKAATQIFYSLGVGFGSLVAFASYSSKATDFVKQGAQVACINCGTSLFAGFVVFPILGFLCMEMSTVNPCIEGDDLRDLASIGLSGTGLAFIAFPIAIDRMAFGKFFWAFLFFVMLFCLGIDSQFAMVESVMTVLHDAKVGHNMPKPMLTAIVCFISWFCGLIFVTRGGIYWFNLFDYYTCVVAMFFITLLECIGVAWLPGGVYEDYVAKVKAFTGRQLPPVWKLSYMVICPVLICGLLSLAIGAFDIMGARKSVRFPEGEGFLPEWSIWAGWFIGLVPVAGFFLGTIPWPYTVNSNTPRPASASASLKQSNEGRAIELETNLRAGLAVDAAAAAIQY